MSKKNSRKKKKHTTVISLVLLVVFSLTLFWASGGVDATVFESGLQTNLRPGNKDQLASTSGESAPESQASLPAQQGVLPEEMRAMWISYLEWQMIDLATEASARSAVAHMFDRCVEMGMNTVIVAVRPFGDAFYKSSVFPWSHLLTGTQGRDPGYDPLSMMVEEAHARSLRIEAWLNPYRVTHAVQGPSQLSQDNPASLHPEWVREVGGALSYDPGIPEVRQLLLDGVLEIVQGYKVDGIHFDDYFYPEGSSASFDDKTYARYGGGAQLADWRRENVNILVRDVYAGIKNVNPDITFGISPQGNNDVNFNIQYSDVNLWLSEPGYADYVMPQLYWGFNYSVGGNDSAAFANKCAEWSAYPRDSSVKLYAGLGAYRIGMGDGGDNNMEEWNSGHNIADMVKYLRNANGFSGFAAFRYEFLAAEGGLYAKEREALTALLTGSAT